MSERAARSDFVVLAHWVSADGKDQDRPPGTVFEVVHAAKTPGSLLKEGERLALESSVVANPGDLFLLLGRRQAGIEWDDPLPVTETSYQYVIRAPPPESRPRERLPYFLKFLEYPDETVAQDAYFEFANADYRDIAALVDKLPRRKLRRWLAEPDFSNRRIGLYGMMLGLCGTEEDARLLEKHITAPAPTADFRLGIDGMIGGYLLLTGRQGLEVIDRQKLRDPNEPTTEIYMALQALRFMWTYGDGRIGRERLRQSMRILLDRPGLADIAVTDLARWKDWSIQDRLMKLYEHEDYQVDHVKRAIIGYMIACARDVPEDADQKPKHAAQADRYLRALRKKDPELVERTERLFGDQN